jgi:hypothetical protein
MRALSLRRGRPVPRLEIVVELEELAVARLVAYSVGDERRLLADLQSRSSVAGEVADALAEALRVLRGRAGAT